MELYEVAIRIKDQQTYNALVFAKDVVDAQKKAEDFIFPAFEKIETIRRIAHQKVVLIGEDDRYILS